MRISHALKRFQCVSQSKLHNLSRRDLNHAFFSSGIVSHDSAYVAGWMVTDAHFRKNRNEIHLNLSFNDYRVMDTIQSILQSGQKVTIHMKKNGISFCRICFPSKQLTRDILRLFPCDWHNKCATLSSCVHLFDRNSQYTSSFVRGVSDGKFDLRGGSIRWKLGGSSYKFITGIGELIYKSANIKLHPSETISLSGKAFYEISVAQADLISFGKWMYDPIDETVHVPKLERKFERDSLLTKMYAGNKWSTTRLERTQIFAKYQVQEYWNKVQTFENLTAIMHQNNNDVKFAPSFLKGTCRGRDKLFDQL